MMKKSLHIYIYIVYIKSRNYKENPTITNNYFQIRMTIPPCFPSWVWDPIMSNLGQNDFFITSF